MAKAKTAKPGKRAADHYVQNGRCIYCDKPLKDCEFHNQWRKENANTRKKDDDE